MLSRLTENLIGRLSGPMKFRLILQPLMAIIFAVRAGLNDAHEGRPPYFWGIFVHRKQRRTMLRDGWKSVGRIFIFAIIMDAIYQIVVFHWFYPGEALVVAVVLAIVPYLLVRGPVNRIARLMPKKRARPRAAPVTGVEQRAHGEGIAAMKARNNANET